MNQSANAKMYPLLVDELVKGTSMEKILRQ